MSVIAPTTTPRVGKVGDRLLRDDAVRLAAEAG